MSGAAPGTGRGRAAGSSWSALGTRVSVLAAEPRALPDVRALVERQLDELDRACSRFREDSELARVNRRTGSWTRVSELLLELVRTALRAAHASEGRVDPTVGRALRLAGYDRDFAELAGAEPRVVRFVATPGWRAVEVDDRRSAVRVPHHAELDLGASAKAFAADRAARDAAALVGGAVMVNLGGDLAVAGPPPPRAWTVRVTDDHAAPADAPGQTVSIRSGGLATSSITVRRWTGRDERLHHILDPSTGRPAAPVWRTVSVAAASCVDANTASTAAIVQGAAAPAWLARARLPARLVAPDGAVVTAGGWPESPR